MDEAILMHELKNFLNAEGKLKGYPSKHRLKALSIFYLASKFEQDIRYSEKEVNELLARWHTFDDWCMLRRELYDRRFLGRERDCSFYWLEKKQPSPADFGVELR